ncbi:hypothetical protein MLD38_023091 [Melastoma candidum]|uniref:Uncharacterized protein n=1 Tax=Melastoma candidum TaxID=119954 RepID=A0ACB9QUK1_9MYRT|nr:hypothetical protein MLD38_023091 [Melastoma candidum]
MGCVTSKLDDLPAVALCRERCSSLDQAIRLRYSLSNSHLSYFHSLSTLPPSFSSFFPTPPSPLPPPAKPTPSSSAALAPGSHIDFLHDDDDSDDDLSDDHFHHDSGDLTPLHHHLPPTAMLPQFPSYDDPSSGFFSHGGGGGGGDGGFFHINYMMNKASTPSVVYQQRPVSYQTVHFGESSSSSNSSSSNSSSSFFSSSSSSSSMPQYPYQKIASANPDNTGFGGGDGGVIYPNYDFPGYGNGGMGGGYYANSPPRQSYGVQAKPPPPPPSPPRASAWELLNPFESYEMYYPASTPSRDLKELREEEGIPDLEDEHEVVKEVHGKPKFVGHWDQEFVDHGNQKFVDTGKSHGHTKKGDVIEEEDDDEEDDDEFHRKADSDESTYQGRPSVVSIGNDEGNDDGAEYEVHVVDKKVVGGEGRSGQGGGDAARGSRSVAEALAEIEHQFRRASECGTEVAKLLEVGKLPYNRKHRVAKSTHVALKGSAARAALPPISAEDADQAQAGTDEQLGMKSGNLSSTLQKLYLWEKKLYGEVKSEERMRVIHDRNVQKLRRLDERGAEAHKVVTTRTLIRNLSTKIRMAIQVVDRISVTINKIRDEELWPQINELIEGLLRMWESLRACHRSQCLALKESQSLDSIVPLKKLGDDHLDATLQFQRELIDWTFRFANWASTQKGFVIALNSWLLKCLLYEPENTPDGPIPFSPGRIGAPAIFVICNQWSQSMEKISEKEVVNSMYAFAAGVLQFWERGKLEMQNRSVGNKDLEKLVKYLDKEDQKIQKQVHALEKKMIQVSGDVEVQETGKLVYQSDISRSNYLQESLQQTFEAMERFSTDSMTVYQELLQRCEEEGISRGRNRSS